jgi:5-(carboxyamino)imidazole ribonucleotide synthase
MASTETLRRGSVIGIVGGGQLGRMLAQAAAKLGFRTSIFAPEADSPAFEVAAIRHCAPYSDKDALARFAAEADIVTFEFENIPAATLAVIEQGCRVSPPRRALEVAQNRITERRFLASLGLPVPTWIEIGGSGELQNAYGSLAPTRPGGMLFLKRATQGYDGKGQIKIRTVEDLPAAEHWLGADRAVLECGVDFEIELSVICARDAAGAMVFYDPPHNVHEDGILRESIVPAPITPDIRQLAFDHASLIAVALDYVGVLAVEMFLTKGADESRLLINEIAPRVHNSGHWTTEACAVSQFENHIRAVAGWPLGTAVRHSDARLTNILGAEADLWEELLRANPARSLHLYGKAEARAGRKMGHYVDILPH